MTAQGDLDRVAVVGRYALSASNEREPRHRVMRFYDLESENVDRLKRVDGRPEISGEMLASFYLGTVIERLTEQEEKELNLGKTGRRLTSSEKPEVLAFARLMRKVQW